jgi:predicted MFS family arabinose efflux permease
MALPGFVWGFGLGTTVGTPLGAHLANRTHGDFPCSLLASTILFAAEVVTLNLLVEDGRTEHRGTTRAVVAITPILQVVSSVYIEQRTGRSR